MRTRIARDATRVPGLGAAIRVTASALIGVALAAMTIGPISASAGSTRLVKDPSPDAGFSGPVWLRRAGALLYLGIDEVGTGGCCFRRLWRSDGTSKGTYPLPADDLSWFHGPLGHADGLAFFAGYELPDTGGGLLATDGTGAGTSLVKEINGDLHPGAPLSGTLHFLSEGSLGPGALWSTDGTEAGTVRVTNLREAQGLASAAQQLFFCAPSDVGSRAAIWRSDGTAAGTRALRNLPLRPCEFTAFRGSAFFMTKRALWRTDGTAAGTVLVKDGFGPEPFGHDLTVAGGRLFFVAGACVDGHGSPPRPVCDFELWRTDGTTRGTRRVKDIRPGPYGSRPQELTPVRNILYFSAYDGAHGRELWKSNGTVAGTRLVKDILPDGAARPEGLASLDGMLYFAARGPTFRRDGLWASDGTAAGTRRVRSAKSAPVPWRPYASERCPLLHRHQGRRREGTVEACPLTGRLARGGPEVVVPQQ